MIAKIGPKFYNGKKAFCKGGLPMTLMQLRYFQTLASMLNYTKAAEALHISQPSLSYAIAELEKDLEVPLLARKNRRVALTPYGEFFLTYATRVLATLEEGVRMTRQMVLAPAAGGGVFLQHFLGFYPIHRGGVSKEICGFRDRVSFCAAHEQRPACRAQGGQD